MANTTYQMKEVLSSCYNLLSGEGLTSCSINNRTNFFGEKMENEVFGASFFENTHKNFKLNLVLVLVLDIKSKALYCNGRRP